MAREYLVQVKFWVVEELSTGHQLTPITILSKTRPDLSVSGSLNKTLLGLLEVVGELRRSRVSREPEEKEG